MLRKYPLEPLVAWRQVATQLQASSASQGMSLTRALRIREGALRADEGRCVERVGAAIAAHRQRIVAAGGTGATVARELVSFDEWLMGEREELARIRRLLAQVSLQASTAQAQVIVAHKRLMEAHAAESLVQRHRARWGAERRRRLAATEDEEAEFAHEVQRRGRGA